MAAATIEGGEGSRWSEKRMRS